MRLRPARAVVDANAMTTGIAAERARKRSNRGAPGRQPLNEDDRTAGITRPPRGPRALGCLTRCRKSRFWTGEEGRIGSNPWLRVTQDPPRRVQLVGADAGSLRGEEERP